MASTTPVPGTTEQGRRIQEEILQQLEGKRVVIPDLFKFLPGWEWTINPDVQYISLKVNNWVARCG